MSSVKCIDVKHGLFSDKVTLEGIQNDSFECDSFLGVRRFCIKPGERVKVKVPKAWLIQKDDKRKLIDWIDWNAVFTNQAFELNWEWKY